MIIRMVFEPHKNVNVNHDKMFEYYSENYLSDFDTTWGGYITLSASEMAHSDIIANQPCYQRYIESSKGDQATLNKIMEILHVGGQRRSRENFRGARQEQC